MVYKILLPLSSLDIIPPEISTEILFTFSEKYDFPYSDRFEELGFDSHNMISNVGSMFYYIAVAFILLIQSLLFKFVFKCKNKFTTKVKKHLKWVDIMN